MLVDAGAAVLCVLVFWLPVDRSLDGLVIALIVLVVGGLLTRSRWPVVAFGVVAAATLAGALLGVTRDPFVAAAWTLYPVAIAHGSAHMSRAMSVSLGLVVAALVLPGYARAEDIARYVIVSLLFLAGAWRLGEAVRRERVEAEHAARAEGARAVLAERLRVAREVHDVVSHSLGTIAVTAGVAAHVDGDNAEKLRRKLAQIERASKDALGDLRAVLGAVREPGEQAERSPQPGIADLPALLDGVRSTGIDVRLTMSGAAGIPAGTGLAVYRIAQEGLTNAARHAPGCSCEVTVTASSQTVTVEVIDDGGTLKASPAKGGFGLIGLRERVESLGGELTVGPREVNGFALRASLPYSERDG
ncbi:sensor histidine kinase [Saccharomonospora sp. NPDC046836]|uniref:sensor histidine kinase n=1 Tax=Saccharomonospora sp. NPDC046836 TaxID=3156921 RepID=UPI0033CAFAD4